MKACTQCGRCCTYPNFMGSMNATRNDIERWHKQHRYDIIQWCDQITGDLWFHPITDKEQDRCPFVRKVRNKPIYTCTIYDTRPTVCRNYPSNVSHMKTVDCEMLEPGDTDEDVAAFMESCATECNDTCV